MKSNEEITIRIVDKRWASRLISNASVAMLTIGPILVGKLIDSQAMQWMGFFLSIVTIFGFAATIATRNEFHSIEDARKRLDELERGQ